MPGLTYWHLNENELYHPLPDSFDSGAYLLLQEASMNLVSAAEAITSLSCFLGKRLDLFQCFWMLSCLSTLSVAESDPGAAAVPQRNLSQQAKNRLEAHRMRKLCYSWLFVPSSVSHDSSLITSAFCWASHTPCPSSTPQMLTLDPSGNQRQSDHTSGFTSPSHFSSPSFHLCPRVHTPVSPDSMVEYSPNPGDTDGISDTSSVSAARPSKAQSTWGFHNKAQPCSRTTSQQYRASAPLASEEEGSNTHTSTLIPCTGSAAAQGSAASPQMEKTSSPEDPVVLSLWVPQC